MTRRKLLSVTIGAGILVVAFVVATLVSLSLYSDYYTPPKPAYVCLQGLGIVDTVPGEVFGYPGVYLCGIDLKYHFEGFELPGPVINRQAVDKDAY